MNGGSRRGTVLGTHHAGAVDLRTAITRTDCGREVATRRVRADWTVVTCSMCLATKRSAADMAATMERARDRLLAALRTRASERPGARSPAPGDAVGAHPAVAGGPRASAPGLDGRWTALDGRDLYRHRLAADAIDGGAYLRVIPDRGRVQPAAEDLNRV